MKLLNKFILSISFLGLAQNAMAYALPPVTNTEVKEHADYLVKHQMFNTAKKYYKELENRGDLINARWGLTLVDIANGDNFAALNKVNYLLKQEKVKQRPLQNLQAKILVNLAEKEMINNKPEKALSFLNAYFTEHNGHYELQDRAMALKNKIENTNFKQQINIGVILPLTGKLASVGKKVQQALTLALYNQNLNNITLYFEDNRSTQEGSIEAATNILNKNVRMIIGPILRDNVLAANTVIGNTQTPIFTFSNDESIAGNNIFLNNINIKQEAYEITRFAADHKNQRLACLTPANRYGNIEKSSFENATKLFNVALENCQSFDPKNIDVNKSLKRLLEIDKNERIRLAELRKLEREFEKLGNAMDDEKIQRMEELNEQKDIYDINFNAIYIPTSAKKLLTIAPQLAFYDIDFSNGVLFLGPSAWDDKAILKNRGEHLHFTRFLSLKSDKYKTFAKQYKQTFASQPNMLAGFAYDILEVANNIDFRRNFYQQIHQPHGFPVLTGNVRFNQNNIPERIYGVNKISRRTIKEVVDVKHLRPIELPKEMNIERSSGFGNWFGF
tara:strand:+ start:5805 stop:7484 length:1680 start_codon:yes stop_codon:yes gene_type:complete